MRITFKFLCDRKDTPFDIDQTTTLGDIKACVEKYHTINFQYTDANISQCKFTIYCDDPDSLNFFKLYKYLTGRMPCADLTMHALLHDKEIPPERPSSFPFESVDPAIANELSALNGVQKNILDTTLYFIFEDLSEIKPAERIQILEKTLDFCEYIYQSCNRRIFHFENELDQNTIRRWKQLGIWETIVQIFEIYKHPCPQNRAENYPYFDKPSDRLVVYKDELTGLPRFEHKGLLSLTARAEQNSRPLSKRLVTEYITNSIQREILQIKRKAAASIQFWFRKTRDENKVLSSIDDKNDAVSAQCVIRWRNKKH